MAGAPAHNCPAARCTRRVAAHQLMCRPHWYMVPKPLRDAVYDAYRGGLAGRSPAHRAAVTDAIGAVNAKLVQLATED